MAWNEIGYAGAIEVSAFVSSDIYRSTATMSDKVNAKGEDTSLCSLADDVWMEDHAKVRIASEFVCATYAAGSGRIPSEQTDDNGNMAWKRTER